MPDNAPWPQSTVKRLLDMLFAAGLLILLSPIMLLMALVIRCQLGSPVLFRQPRPGRHGTTFTLTKFRTLPNPPGASEAPAGTPPPSRLVTRIRASGLDELPELFNILKGDMSFVGPRPLLVRYLERYSPEQNRRHEVRPGLTGLAQVNGRNALDWDSRLKLDVDYVTSATALTDLQILARTLLLIFRGEGTAEPEEFMGSE